MKNKYLAFAKNMGISIAAAVAAGVGASEAAELFTSDGKLIGAISTASQYAASVAAFVPMHAIDNRDIYHVDGKWNLKRLVVDCLKIGGSLLPLDVAYVLGRPFTQDYFLDNGFGASKSSLAADAVWMSSYLALTYPVAKITGIFHKKKNLEKIASEETAAREVKK